MGVISLVSVYASTEASDLTVKEAFYAALESVVDQCPRRNTLLILGDFNASTGTERDGDETCVGPCGSRTVNQNSTKCMTLQEVMDFGWLVHVPTGSSLDLVVQRWQCGKGD